MTEYCGMCAILPPELMHYGAVGLPVSSIHIKLRDVPDAGYLSSNEVQQGEICIHGPLVVKGYYKCDDLNNNEPTFTTDGWLRTGDSGILTELWLLLTGKSPLPLSWRATCGRTASHIATCQLGFILGLKK